MNKTIPTFLLAAGLLAGATAHALTIDTVVVGNAVNTADSTSYGAVSYDYHVGTHEVTNGQYAAFLNDVAASDPHGLYNPNMGSSIHGGIDQNGSAGNFFYTIETGFGDKPVNFVSYWDATRFSNWLTTGDTETGVYNLTQTGIDNNTITRDATAWANGGVAITSEDEWYKAAYYDGSGGYWDYPSQSNTPTSADAPPGGANSANISGNGVESVTSVGAYTLASSYYGTFDQGGNLWEFNDAIVGSDNRGMRGGNFGVGNIDLHSSFRQVIDPTSEDAGAGFRVSSLEPIPEPSTYAALYGLVVLGLAVLSRRGRRQL